MGCGGPERSAPAAASSPEVQATASARAQQTLALAPATPPTAAATTAPAQVTLRRESRLGSTWRRLRRSNLVVASGCFLVLMVIVAAAAPLLAPYDPLAMQPAVRFQGPSLAHLFGTDEYGRDVLSRLIYGALISLEVGIISVGISLVVGAILGSVAGYYGHAVDMLISRLMDVLFAFPAILLAIALMAMLGSDIRNVMLAIGIVNVPIFMRVARASTLTVRTTQYVEAARASGARDVRMLGRDILPNIAPPLIVQATLAFAWAIIAEAALSFLGLGTQPPTPSWGIMLSTGRTFMQQNPSDVIFSGAAISLAVLSLNILGDGLRDALDPRMKLQ
ncbi:MAG: ABC transporter permease [Chloroflexi bacterium]|nr:ABC transporter permease [Chloroflexota bacterium]